MMRICEHCGRQIAATTADCPHCRWWSEETVIGLMRHHEAGVRAQAASDTVFVIQRTERLVRALAVAFRDPIVSVRQKAGVALFICGQDAVAAVPELIEGLDDPDLKVRRLAAASLSMIGPRASAALPILARLHDAEDEKLRTWVREAETRLAEQ